VLHVISGKSYRFCQQLIPLPAKSLLEQKYQTLIHLDKLLVIDKSGIALIVGSWQPSSGIDYTGIIEILLAFDVMIFK
jgi:hypothetical protein